MKKRDIDRHREITISSAAHRQPSLHASKLTTSVPKVEKISFSIPLKDITLEVLL